MCRKRLHNSLAEIAQHETKALSLEAELEARALFLRADLAEEAEQAEIAKREAKDALKARESMSKSRSGRRWN